MKQWHCRTLAFSTAHDQRLPGGPVSSFNELNYYFVQPGMKWWNKTFSWLSGDTSNLPNTLEDCVFFYLFKKKKKAIVWLIVTDHFMEELQTVLAVTREFASYTNPRHDCWYCQIRHLKPIFPWAAEEPLQFRPWCALVGFALNNGVILTELCSHNNHRRNVHSVVSVTVVQSEIVTYAPWGLAT